MNCELSGVLGFRLAFEIRIEDHSLAVEAGEGELGNPVAEDEYAGRAGEHEVKFNVAMAEDEVVDIGVGLEVLLGKEAKRLLVLALIGWLLAVFTLETRVLGPFEAEAHAPTGMDGGEERLAEPTVEERADETEAGVHLAETVTMGDEKGLAIELYCLCFFAMQFHATFALEVVLYPNIVVAREVVHLHAEVGKFGDFAEKASVASGYDGTVFIPEVEHVAKKVDGSSLVLNAVEEVDKAPFLGAAALDGQ